MKQIICPIFCVMGIAGVVAIWLWMMISAYKPALYPVSYYTPDYVESYTVGSFDQLRICKVYYLAPEDTTDRISTEDFQEYGRCFSLLELTKESGDKTDMGDKAIGPALCKAQRKGGTANGTALSDE